MPGEPWACEPSQDKKNGLITIAIVIGLLFGALALAFLISSKGHAEPEKQWERSAIRSAAIAWEIERLEVVLTSGEVIRVSLKYVNTACDEQLDGTYVEYKAFADGIYAYYKATILLRTQEQKQEWDDRLETAKKYLYAPRDVELGYDK